MSDALLKTALKLSRSERILLAERLWDSVVEEADPKPQLSAAQQVELDRRLRRLKKTGSLGSEWKTVKDRITHQHAQTADPRT